MKRNKGISLIVLVITIVVIVILATAVIVTFVRNNPIESAKNAVDKWNASTSKEEENLLELNWSANFEDFKKDYWKNHKREDYFDANGKLTNGGIFELMIQIRKDLYNEDEKSATIKNTYLAIEKAVKVYGFSSYPEAINALPNGVVDPKFEKGYMQSQLAYALESDYLKADAGVKDRNKNEYYLLPASMFGEDPRDQINMKEIFPELDFPEATGTAEYSYNFLFAVIREAEKQGIDIGVVKADSTLNAVVLSATDAGTEKAIKEGQIAWLYKLPEVNEKWGTDIVGFIFPNVYFWDKTNHQFYYVDDNGYCSQEVPF